MNLELRRIVMDEMPEKLEKAVYITMEQYNEYKKLRKYFCRVDDYYARFKMLVARLMMLDEFLDSFHMENYNREDIEANMDVTITELYNYAERYGNIIKSLDLPEGEANAALID